MLNPNEEKHKAYTSCKVKLVIFYNNLFKGKIQFNLLAEQKKLSEKYELFRQFFSFAVTGLCFFKGILFIRHAAFRVENIVRPAFSVFKPSLIIQLFLFRLLFIHAAPPHRKDGTIAAQSFIDVKSH